MNFPSQRELPISYFSTRNLNTLAAAIGIKMWEYMARIIDDKAISLSQFYKAILAKILKKLHYKRSIDTYSHNTVIEWDTKKVGLMTI